MSNAHTQGPWIIDRQAAGIEVFGADGNSLMTFERSHNELLANARLIAAAPELLSACKVAFDQTCKVGRPKDWEQLRAAIAKAEGGTA